MKKVLLLMCLVAGINMVSAQEETSFSDEELTKYATVMVWAEMEKERMTETYNNWINNDEILEAPRFKKINDAGGDSSKMVELEVTADEKKAYEQIMMSYDSMTSSFKEVYIGKIKGDIGAGLYNALKKELKSSEETKARYQEIYEGLKEEGAISEEDESEE